MRDVARALLIAATLLLLSVPARFGATAFIFATTTAAMVVAEAALVAMFPDRQRDPLPERWHPWAAFAVAVPGAVLVAMFARGWLAQLLIYPHDAQRADMLIVIQEGIRRLLHGDNPYTIYHVPWDATLPYGPIMWLPYAVPFVAHMDVRFVSMLGAMFVPVACAIAAVAAAGAGRVSAAFAALILLAALACSPDLRHFASIAHTPSYWPGLALFASLVAGQRWRAAAIVCGLLIVARTTMVALAPVLIIAVWNRDRSNAVTSLWLLLLAALLPYLPFLLWNPGALTYALYGSYQALMKGFVWTSTTWAHETIGVTGLLLRRGWQSASEGVVITVMLVVYGLAWRSIRRSGPPLPWMAFALFAFSATTLWPVSYIYFDVVLLWIAAALAHEPWSRARGVASSWTATLVAAAGVVALAAFLDIPAEPAIDVGIGATRPFLYKGFSTDEGADPTFAWVSGKRAEILVARRSRGNAEIEIRLEPYLPGTDSTQQLNVALNGVVLGTATLHAGWQSTAFPAPERAWRFGVNELALSLSSAVSPQEAHAGDDPRTLSVAIDRVTVRARR